MPMGDKLILMKTYKDGRVMAANIWKTGFQELVFDSMAAFEAMKLKVETDGHVPEVGSFTTTGAEGKPKRLLPGQLRNKRQFGLKSFVH